MRHHRNTAAGLRLRAVAAVAALSALCSCGVIAENATTSMPTSFSSAAAQGSAMAVTAPAQDSGTRNQMPVYWLGRNGSDIQLYREFLATEHSADPIGEAVAAMTRQIPLDEDYFTPWQPAERVTASISGRNVITVDISSDAFKASLDAGVAHRAVQQLVYTATAAAHNAGLTTYGQEASVVILVDGKADYVAFGHESLRGQLTRDASLTAPIWIIEPQHGDTTQNVVTVSGTAVSHGTPLSWRVDRLEAGKPAPQAAAEGFADLDAATGDTAPFSFEVDLAPGQYMLRVYHGDDGTNEDSKLIKVGASR